MIRMVRAMERMEMTRSGSQRRDREKRSDRTFIQQPSAHASIGDAAALRHRNRLALLRRIRITLPLQCLIRITSSTCCNVIFAWCRTRNMASGLCTILSGTFTRLKLRIAAASSERSRLRIFATINNCSINALCAISTLWFSANTGCKLFEFAIDLELDCT
jgi:hypothetical protein